MRQIPNDMLEKFDRVAMAWATLAPQVSFGGMTAIEFQGRVDAARVARQDVRIAIDQVIAAKNARQDSDDETLLLLLRAVDAIKGHPEFGDNSTLYEACGYVRKSERKSGLGRKAKAAGAEIKVTS